MCEDKNASEEMENEIKKHLLTLQDEKTYNNL